MHKVTWLAVVLLLVPTTATPGADCNRNGMEDPQDIESSRSADCNGNGVPDECDLSPVNLTFEEAASFQLRYNIAGSMASGDLDGNGTPDLVVLGDEVIILLNRGDARFDPGPAGLPPAAYGSVALGDLNGDSTGTAIWTWGSGGASAITTERAMGSACSRTWAGAPSAGR